MNDPGAHERQNPTILSSDVALPEGPLLLPDGTWLVVELDPRRGTVSRVPPTASANRRRDRPPQRPRR